MRASKPFGFIIGLSLAAFIHLYHRTSTPTNLAPPTPTEDTESTGSPLSQDSKESLVAIRSRESRAVEPRSSRVDIKASNSMTSDAIAGIKSEQQRLIALTMPLEHNAKRLGNAMIALLRDLDINRIVHDGKNIDRRILASDIEAAAPIPVVPYGPKLGLLPNQ
jgi:hypothetical protein